MSSDSDVGSEEEMDFTPSNLFWGLNVSGGNKYSQIVSQPFQVCSAALSPEADEGNHHVYATVGGMDYLLCTLNKDKWPQHAINLQLGVGEEVAFSLKPKDATGPVSLSGHFLGLAEDISGEEFGDDEDELEGSLMSDSDEGEEVPAVTKNGKPKVMELPAEVEEKLLKTETALAPPGAESKKRPSQAASQPQAKKSKGPEASAPAQKAPQPAKPKATTLQGGTVAEDVVVGTGPKAKKGQTIGVRYVGRLASNNKVFDSNLQGKPFKFKLGFGEVIKGWDTGVEGMCVGGKRILRIPAAQAYGKRGAPPAIPPNATLVFEVSLLSLK